MKTERKKIRPDYYDEFSCIAGQCPITCCQEWKIAVDADTNRRWKKVLPPDTMPGCAKSQSLDQAMPLSQLFEVLFDSSVVVKYPIF